MRALIGVVTATVMFAIAASLSRHDDPIDHDVETLALASGIAGLADAAMFGVSASHGFRTVDACRAERSARVFAAQ